MWRTFTDSGTLRYSFIESLEAMHYYYIARAFGGLLFLTGAAVGFYNVLMTIRRVPGKSPALDYPTSSEASEPPVPAAE
jgi:cytochrome c oxidase cbb3-type subunit 1